MILTALQVNVARAIGILGNREVNHRSKYIHDSDVEHSSARWPIRDDSTNQRKHKFQKKNISTKQIKHTTNEVKPSTLQTKSNTLRKKSKQHHYKLNQTQCKRNQTHFERSRINTANERSNALLHDKLQTHARTQPKKVERTLQMKAKHSRTYSPTQVKNSLQTKAE